MACSRQGIRWSIEYPKSLGFVGRQKATELHDSTWRTFRRELEATGLIQAGLVKVTGGESKNSPAHIRFDESIGGSEIIFRNFQSGGGLLGTEPDWFFLDEAGEIADDIIELLIGRLSGTPNQDGKVVAKRTAGGRVVTSKVSGPLRGMFASNPGASGYLRNNFRPKGVKGAPAPRHKVFEVPTLDNPYLSPEYVATILERYPEGSAMRAAYIEGDWSAFEGQVVTNFDPDVHVVDDVLARDLKGWHFVEGYDFGWRNPTAYVLMAYRQDGDEPILVLDCYQKNEWTARQHAKRISDIRAKHGVPMERTFGAGDPTGVSKNSSGTSWIDDFAYVGIHISPIEAAKSQPARDRRLISLLGRRIETRSGTKPALQFCRRVVDPLVDNSILLQRYVPESTRNTDDPPDARSKKDDHLHDALCNGLVGAPVFLADEEEPDKEESFEDWPGGNTQNMASPSATLARMKARKRQSEPGWNTP